MKSFPKQEKIQQLPNDCFVPLLPTTIEVEKYSKEAWEIADVRVIKSHRNKGLACDISRYVLEYILKNNKKATIRTESANYLMQCVISKLRFIPLS